MWLPVMQGVIERRLLVNYQVDPAVLARLLPPPFRPQTFNGCGMAGICLIRLTHMRPRGLSGWAGVASENAAHRIAVEWDLDRRRHTGVYVLRRDTNSRLNAAVGGRVFPGVHHLKEFVVQEGRERLEIKVASSSGAPLLHVQAQATDAWPLGSVFSSLDEASKFFQAGSVGYSRARTAGQYEGLELKCRSWRATPAEILLASSSVFDNERYFPRGSAMLDCGLLMRRVVHEWHCRGTLRYAAADSSIAAVASDSTILS
jgi:Uncharacterized conserved protein (COG2071)